MSRMPPIAGDGRIRQVGLVAALAFFQAIAAGVAAFSTRDVFVALRADDPSSAFGPIALIALSGLVIAGLRIGERIIGERVGQNYAAVLRERLFTHLSRMPARAVSGRRAGGLALRFVGDLAAVRGWVSLGLARLISAGIVLPGAGIVLFMLNPSLAIAAITPIIIGLIIMSVIGWRLAPAHKRLRSRRARLAADMTERIPHAPELRLLGRLTIEKQNLARRTTKLIDAALDRAKGAGALRAVPDAASGLAAAGLFVAAFRSGATAAEVAGSMAALGLLLQPMRSLAGVWDKHRAWAAARDKCDKLLAEPRLTKPRNKAAAKTSTLPSGPAPVRFNKVTAGSLKEISASIRPGASVAILGPNGAGKSTLLNLAAGLEQPAQGKVTVAGRHPGSFSATERRALISFGGVRSPVLAGSMRRALTMGAPHKIDDNIIMKFAEKFGLTSAIERLGGLHGRLAEGARNLSSGEVRRLMLTRAAISQPKLLLLDEPDDALDVEGPALVQGLLAISNATSLIVTHNLALARTMDEVWFIDQGKIMEAGAPETLLNGDGPTAKFFTVRSVA